jgi:small-conductance mechanosensitive channel
MTDLSEFFNLELLKLGSISITVFNIALVLAIILGTTIALRVFKRFLKRYGERKEMDPGRMVSLYQIARYFLLVITIVVCLEIIGVRLNVLFASGAALLVGIGLGLQSVFNDFIAGIIILFDGTVEVDDVIQVDGLFGIVEKISIRNSVVRTRDEYKIIIPNHKLINENVINWSHHNQKARFQIEVGVAYGSDTKKVKEVMLKAISGHPSLLKTPPPIVRFHKFGDSSLEFRVLFFSHEIFRIENVLSDMRFSIDEEFRQAGITIPFPQRDLHVKTISGAIPFTVDAPPRTV